MAARRTAACALLLGVTLVCGSAALARVNPPAGKLAPGEKLAFHLPLNSPKWRVRIDSRQNCKTLKPPAPLKYTTNFEVFGLGGIRRQRGAASDGSAGFSFPLTVPATGTGSNVQVNLHVVGKCGVLGVYSATAAWGPYKVAAPVKQNPAKTNANCVGPSETHTRLMREPWVKSPAIVKAVKDAKAKIQSNKQEAPEDFAFDEFAITVDEMPPGLTPEELLERFANDPNATIKNPSFDFWAKFNRLGSGPVKVGTIYDIAIGVRGERGSVIVVEKTSDHFIVQTIEVAAAKGGPHPVSGARQFGFTKNADGSITYYTRGADRPDVELMRLPGVVAQNATWNEAFKGLGKQIEALGGKVRDRKPSSWRFDVPTGC